MKLLFVLFSLHIILLLNTNCISNGWKCVNECPNQFGEYKSGVNDRYYGATKKSPHWSQQIFFTGNLFPIGKGKVVYGPEEPGYKRALIDTGDSYDGNFDWNSEGKYSNYSGEGIYTTANGTITKTIWENDDVKLGAPVEKQILNGMTLNGNFNSEGYLCIGNCLDGYGVKSYKKADLYLVGNFKAGKLEGTGSFFNGEIFLRGTFKKGKLDKGDIFCTRKNENYCSIILEYYQENTNTRYLGYLDISNLPKD